MNEMKKIRIKNLLIISATISIICLITFSLAIPALGEATSLFGLEKAQQVPGIAKSSIPVFVGNIIKWVIGILGIILVGLIIYGGFVYMTSAGNEERVQLAKRILTYAIIGIVIIAAAFIITELVLNALLGGSYSSYSGGTSGGNSGMAGGGGNGGLATNQTGGIGGTQGGKGWHEVHTQTGGLTESRCKKKGESCQTDEDSSSLNPLKYIKSTKCCPGLDCTEYQWYGKNNPDQPMGYHGICQ